MASELEFTTDDSVFWIILYNEFQHRRFEAICKSTTKIKLLLLFRMQHFRLMHLMDMQLAIFWYTPHRSSNDFEWRCIYMYSIRIWLHLGWVLIWWTIARIIWKFSKQMQMENTFWHTQTRTKRCQLPGYEIQNEI